MLNIDISGFTFKRFLEKVTYSKYSWQDNLTDHQHEGGCAIKISINGKFVLNDPQKNSNVPPQGYILYTTLKSINNAFYKLLTGSSNEANIVIDWGSGESQRIVLKKADNKVFLTTVKSRFEFDSYLDKEQVDFSQACEEVIRATTYYKTICMEAAKKVAPDDIGGFMKTLFGEKKSTNMSKYNLDRMSDEEFIVMSDHAERWQPTEEAWRRYKRLHP